MTFPSEHIVKLVENDPAIWITTERMISEDDYDAYVELAFTDPREEMTEDDLERDAHLYYRHKDDCCDPLPYENVTAKFICMYRVHSDPFGMQRAEIRIIKHKHK